MSHNLSRSNYKVQVLRVGDGCEASIAELCIAERRNTPLEALAAALKVEEEAIQTLERQGMSRPPLADETDPFPKVSQLLAKHFTFLAKIAIGYLLVICLTALGLAIVYPTVSSTLRMRVSEYVGSQDAAVDFRKVLSRLGVGLCREN